MEKPLLPWEGVLFWWIRSQDAVRCHVHLRASDLYVLALVIWKITFSLVEWLFGQGSRCVSPALTQGPSGRSGSVPQEAWPVPEVALDSLLQHRCSAPPRYTAPGEETWGRIWYLAMLNNSTPSKCITLASHSNGILSQSVTPHNILYFVWDFLRWRAPDMT